jgi:YHS domain-containing protein
MDRGEGGMNGGKVSAYDKDRDGREGYFSLEHCSVFNERPIELVHVQTMLLQYSAEHRAVWPKQVIPTVSRSD